MSSPLGKNRVMLFILHKCLSVVDKQPIGRSAVYQGGQISVYRADKPSPLGKVARRQA